MVWSHIVPLGAILIFPGLLGAIFSSAVGSMLGAPRTLQALIRDWTTQKKVYHFIESKKGQKVTFVISASVALVAVFSGALNMPSVLKNLQATFQRFLLIYLSFV